MDLTRYPLISALKDPAELRQADLRQLSELAQECRAFLMESIGRTGGHLGAALGVVELTLALYNQFDFSQDKIIWDVGHQAHVHKLLTGRSAGFARYGEWGGMCKFTDPDESPYDHAISGHASTAVSTALGMALARDLAWKDKAGPKPYVVATLGDGSLTGGLAYEALAMAGVRDTDLLVVLNDNGMSIDANVGALSRTITRITSSDGYNALREEVKRVGHQIPFGEGLLKRLKHMERSVKDLGSGEHAAFFESLGFHYFGPLDGHDLKALTRLLSHARSIRGPILLHVLTVKGKGMGPEVENTFSAHAVSPSQAKTKPAADKAKPAASKSWTSIFSESIQEIMAADPQVVAITAAMCSNTGLKPAAERFPGRVFDVGIAEANGYCSAAGMAAGGLKPFVAIYSSFTQRAFDQLIHDVALRRLNVKLMLDRGGLVGGDGPTHHGAYDHSYLRLIPNMVHMAPRDELEFRRMMETAWRHEGPIALRYPRGDTPAMQFGPLQPLPVGQGERLVAHPKPDVALVAAGSMVAVALQTAQLLAQQEVACSVIDARFIKPLDEALLLEEAQRARCMVTMEESARLGGMGEGIAALLATGGKPLPMAILAIPDRFIPFGDVASQLEDCGLTAPQAAQSALALLASTGWRAPRPKSATA